MLLPHLSGHLLPLLLLFHVHVDAFLLEVVHSFEALSVEEELESVVKDPNVRQYWVNTWFTKFQVSSIWAKGVS